MEQSRSEFYRANFNPVFLAKAKAKQRAIEAESARKKRIKEAGHRKAALAAIEARQAIANAKASAEVEKREHEAAASLNAANRTLIKLRYGIDCPTIEEILGRFCKATGVSRIDVLSHRRSRKVALVRQAVYYWCHRRTPHTLVEIGRRLGGKDHTSVLYGIRAYPDKRAAQGRTLRQARP